MIRAALILTFNAACVTAVIWVGVVLVLRVGGLS